MFVLSFAKRRSYALRMFFRPPFSIMNSICAFVSGVCCSAAVMLAVVAYYILLDCVVAAPQHLQTFDGLFWLLSSFVAF